MIEGGWSYIWGAYAGAAIALGVLVVIVATRARYWADRARKLDRSAQ